MKIYEPDYYKSFSCIADKCKHNCCIGWEIDIDKKTYRKYKTIKGTLGKRLKEGIEHNGETPCFKLKNNRCWFLNDKNLCDIISEKGENALCEICREHPRFKNFFDSRMELGLGLCCEAAAHLILTYKNPVKIISRNHVEKESDDIFFEIRSRVFGLLQNRDISVSERLTVLENKLKISINMPENDEIAKIFLGLERMDEEWTNLLLNLKASEKKDDLIFCGEEWEIFFEQLLVYFIYRHLPAAREDGSYIEKIVFAYFSYYTVKEILKALYKEKEDISIEDGENIARLFSAEIEYSTDNTKELYKKAEEMLK